MSKEQLLREIDAALARITAEEAAATEHGRPDMLEDLAEKRRKLNALQVRVHEDTELA